MRRRTRRGTREETNVDAERRSRHHQPGAGAEFPCGSFSGRPEDLWSWADLSS